jgi:YVTN family beta-propeller protein
MTDIVGSTEHAAELGDSAWRELVQQHHRLVRTALRRHGGREIDTAGDGFFAVFDAPAAALVCALDIVGAVKELGIDVRAGLHVGEVEQIGMKVGGIAVPIAARIMDAAMPGEVLVSATVRDLAAGSRLTFDDRGLRELKGVPGEWHVYAVGDALPEAVETAGALTASERRAIAVRRAQARPIWQRRPRLVTFVVLAVAAVIAVGALLAIKPWQTPALAGIGEDAVGIIDAGRAEIVGSIGVGSRPGGVALSESGVWVTNTGSDTVVRIDPGTRTITREIDVGRGPTGVAVADGSIWVANSAERSVTRINEATARVVDTIEVGNGPTALAAAAGALWVANTTDSTLVRIDTATGLPDDPIPVAAGPTALAVDENAVWIGSADAATVTRLDPASRVTVTAPIALPSRPAALAIDAGAVWVASEDGTATRIDSATNRVTATIDVGGSLSAVVTTENAVWLADRQGYIHRLDSANPSAAPTRIETGSAPEGLAVVGGNLWVAARATAATHRGGTLRIVFGTDYPRLDPAGFPTGNAAMLQADGLMGYRRVGGTAGSVLLPDLATAIPRPTNGGTIFTFQLRPDLVYSDGRQVKPEDFRRAIERSFQGAPGSFALGNVMFTSIKGAEDCATPDLLAAESCDLSAGITTDATARTVTFELIRPDPDFLAKLAIPSSYPVPEGVPMNAPIEGAFPGTGPYTVSATSQTEIRLIRNPHFRVWDADVRPDGFPHEIVFMIGIDAEERAAMVARGDADFMVMRGPNRSPELIGRLRTQYPGQLRFGSVTLFAAVMNASIPPFDRLEARQAVNMAIDRAQVADLYGGEPGVAVTCQILPPGYLGYRPYCPYTSDPDAGGQWHGPDMESAQRLVDASGTRGARVVVGPVDAEASNAANHLATVLEALGYDASVDPETDPQKVSAAQSEGRVQISAGIFIPGFLAPSQFLARFTCGGDPVAQLCDANFDALVSEARVLQTIDIPAAAAKWAEADRMATDLAIMAPLFNEGTDFISSRVGNYQFHPAYLFLWDQLWVQ